MVFNGRKRKFRKVGASEAKRKKEKRYREIDRCQKKRQQQFCCFSPSSNVCASKVDLSVPMLFPTVSDLLACLLFPLPAFVSASRGALLVFSVFLADAASHLTAHVQPTTLVSSFLAISLFLERKNKHRGSSYSSSIVR